MCHGHSCSKLIHGWSLEPGQPLMTAQGDEMEQRSQHIRLMKCVKDIVLCASPARVN